MNPQVEFVNSKVQILQEIRSNIGKLSEKSMPDVQQMSTEAETVTKRCKQMVTDLAEARQEEHMLLNELNQLSERRPPLHD